METMFFNFIDTYNSNIIKQLGKDLKNGSVGIFPTDTVYGIGCNAFNNDKIKQIFKIKKRDFSKPINVLISDLQMLYTLVEDISIEEKKLVNAFWPGDLTLIFNKKNSISNILTADYNTIGIRIPNNRISLDLIKSSGVPLATTSANISGKPSGTDVNDFKNQFNGKVDFIINGGTTQLKKASTIVQIINGKVKILREGSISKEQINRVLED